jgi:hypothetical protein
VRGGVAGSARTASIADHDSGARQQGDILVPTVDCDDYLKIARCLPLETVERSSQDMPSVARWNDDGDSRSGFGSRRVERTHSASN